MSTLVGLQRVKAHANLPAADAQFDTILNLLREKASREVEHMTGRAFAKLERTEYFESYEQIFGDPSPQYLFPNAAPIDTGETTTLIWAPYDDHADNGTPLVEGEDWRFQTDRDGAAIGLRIQRFSTFPTRFPLPAGATAVLGYSPTGFQLTYTGGYDVSAVPAAPPAGQNPDPCAVGEGDVVAVPDGLASIVALKVAGDFKHLRKITRGNGQDVDAMLTTLQTVGAIPPWTDAQLASVRLYNREDHQWIGSGNNVGQVAGGFF